jgi:hypothetical protein
VRGHLYRLVGKIPGANEKSGLGYMCVYLVVWTPYNVDFSYRTLRKRIFAGRHSSKLENCSWTPKLIKYCFLCDG